MSILIVQLLAGDETLLKLEYATDLSPKTLQERIPLLLDELSLPAPVLEVSARVSLRYVGLARRLLLERGDELQLSFAEIELILRRRLPNSARTQRAWWANTAHAQASAWLESGWKMLKLDLHEEIVKFRRTVQ